MGEGQRLVTIASLLGLIRFAPLTLARVSSAQSLMVGRVYVNADTARENTIAALTGTPTAC